jgi:hypothetical protein
MSSIVATSGYDGARIAGYYDQGPMADATRDGRRSSHQAFRREEDDMLSTRALTTGIVTAAALMAPLGTTVAAHAQGGSAAVTHSGSCSGSANWKLSAKHDDTGKIEVEWQVDSNKAGQSWTVRLRDNGQLFMSGTRTTAAPSGSFTVHRLTANRAGDDVIRARSVHGAQVCRGSVTV